jgi:hypothetical protein
VKIISWSGQGAVFLLVISASGHHAGLVPFRLAAIGVVVGLLLCTLVALVEVILLSLAAVKKRPLRLDYLLLAAICSIGPGLAFYRIGIDGIRAPMMHDITSDTVNPPVFRLTEQDERFRENSLIYGDDGISAEQLAAIQLSAYPDIRTMTVEVPARRVYQKALFVSSMLGWKVSAQDLSILHFEAQGTTDMFGLAYDIVVRITSLGEQSSAIDIRSVARAGRYDMGNNAKRIRLFFDKLGEELTIL